MKKLFAILLTVAMLATLAVPVFAADAPIKGSASVYFEVAPTFTVTIPETVELTEKNTDGVVTYENDYTISASENLRLKKYEYVSVSLESDFVMETAETATLTYAITVNGTEIENGDEVATFDTSIAAQTATIHIAAGDPEFAGRYEDAVTFTIAVKSARR